MLIFVSNAAQIVCSMDRRIYILILDIIFALMGGGDG